MVIVCDQSPDKTKSNHEVDEDLPRLTGSFTEQVIKIALANICSNIGWHSIGSVSLDILTQVTEQWIAAAGRYSVHYSNQAGRSEVTLPDLLRALEDRLKFSLPDLQDYVQNVSPHPISIKIPRFPANVRPSNRLVFALDHETPFGEDVVIGYAQVEDEGDASESNECEEGTKLAIRRSEYYDPWLPPFPSDSTGSHERIQANGTGENANSNTGSDLKVSEIEPAPPLSAVYINKDGLIISYSGKDGKAPEPSFPELDSELESGSESDNSLNLSKEEPEQPKVEKISIKTSRLPKINKKMTSSPSEKGTKGRPLKSAKKQMAGGPVLSIKVSGLHSGTPTASPKLASTESSVLTPAMEERMDSVIDSVIASVAGRSPSPPPAPVNSRAKDSSGKSSTSKKSKGFSSKEFVSDSEDSDEDDQKQQQKQQQQKQQQQKQQPKQTQKQPSQGLVSAAGPGPAAGAGAGTGSGPQTVREEEEPVESAAGEPGMEPVPAAAAAGAAATGSSAAPCPAKVPVASSPLSPNKSDREQGTVNVALSSPSKAARKMYPEDIKEAAKILLDISETPVVTQPLDWSLRALAPSPPAPKIVTLAARKVFVSPTPRSSSPPSEDEGKVKLDESRKRKKDKKNKKDKKKKRDEKDKDRKKDKKRPSSPDPSLKVNIKLPKEKDKKPPPEPEQMALTQSSSKKDTSTKETSKQSSCILITETIATISSDGKKSSSHHSSGTKNSTSKSSNKSNSSHHQAPVKKAVITETVAEPEEDDKIWICPTCKKQDDGSPMICCDNCQEWFHYPCVGVKEDPTDDSWFCPGCTEKQKKYEKKFESAKKRRVEAPEIEDDSERKKRRKKKPG